MKRYLARCKLTSALAFFQWRCRTAPHADCHRCDEGVCFDKNKHIFDQRVTFLIKCIEEGIKKKKQILEEHKNRKEEKK